MVKWRGFEVEWVGLWKGAWSQWGKKKPATRNMCVPAAGNKRRTYCGLRLVLCQRGWVVVQCVYFHNCKLNYQTEFD